MSIIEDLKKKIQSLSGQLAAARKSLDAAKHDACEIKVGQIVESRGEQFRICDISFKEWSDKPTLHVNPKKQDGTFGTRRKSLWWDNWTLVDESEPSVKNGGAA